MSDLNSAYQNYVRTSVKINAVNLSLACVIVTKVCCFFFSGCLKTRDKVWVLFYIHFKIDNINYSLFLLLFE